MKNKVIGLCENIFINGRKLKAKIDTGADMSSVDERLAKELNLGPSLGKKKYKNVHGVSVRNVVEANILINGMKIKTKFSVADRKDLRHPILLGKNTIKGFIIDTNKK